MKGSQQRSVGFIGRSASCYRSSENFRDFTNFLLILRRGADVSHCGMVGDGAWHTFGSLDKRLEHESAGRAVCSVVLGRLEAGAGERTDSVPGNRGIKSVRSHALVSFPICTSGGRGNTGRR